MAYLIQSVFKRVKSRGFVNALYYSIGRFYTFRSMMTVCNRFFSRSPAVPTRSSVFPDVDVDQTMKDLDHDSYSPVFVVSKELLDGINRHVAEEQCVALLGDRRYRFLYKDRHDQEKHTGEKFIRAHYPDPWLRCEAAKKIQTDPVLSEIGRRFLGRTPRFIDSQLFWSFVVDASDEERLKNHQTVRFHYDVHGFNFIYFNFYLSDVSHGAGEHLLVAGSHRKKKPRHLLSSANQSDEEIEGFYGRDRIIPVYGKPGFGFAEDASCYHKVTPPTEKDRLMLQVRMSI